MDIGYWKIYLDIDDLACRTLSKIWILENIFWKFWILENYLDIDDLTCRTVSKSVSPDYTSLLHFPGVRTVFLIMCHTNTNKDKDKDKDRDTSRGKNTEKDKDYQSSPLPGGAHRLLDHVSHKDKYKDKDTNKLKNAEKDKDYFSSLLLWEEKPMFLTSNQVTF